MLSLFTQSFTSSVIFLSSSLWCFLWARTQFYWVTCHLSALHLLSTVLSSSSSSLYLAFILHYRPTLSCLPLHPCISPSPLYFFYPLTSSFSLYSPSAVSWPLVSSFYLSSLFLPSSIPPPVFLQLLTWIGSPAVHAHWSNQSVHSPFLPYQNLKASISLLIFLHSFRLPLSLSVGPSSHLETEFSAVFLFLPPLI